MSLYTRGPDRVSWSNLRAAVASVFVLQCVSQAVGDVTLSCASRSSCTVTGWPHSPYAYNTQFNTVCGKSFCPPATMSLEAAVGTCNVQGGRLCTRIELAADVARLSGCGFDSKLVWTSDLCGTNGVMVAGGSSTYDRPS